MISSINCHTTKISEYVDYFFQPIVKEIPSYVQDFLRKVYQIDFVLDNSYLVSLDGKSLYTIFQVKKESNPSKRPLKSILKWTASAKVITTFLALILALSNFIFKCKKYLQIKGCAMGAITLIRKYLYGPLLKKIHTPIYQDILLIYLRFIGDMFLIWTGGNTDLEKF